MEENLQSQPISPLADITTGVEKISTDSGDMYVFSLTQKELIPKFVERQGKEYISYGEKNTYPNLLVDLLNTSPTHKRTFDKIVLNVPGKEIKIKGDKVNPKLQSFIERCNSKGESLHDVICKQTYDYALYNAFSTTLIKKDFADVFETNGKYEFFHTDFSTLRPAVAEPLTGYIPNWFFSNNWNQFTTSEQYIPIPTFNANSTDTRQVNIFSKYASTQVYFSSPRYSSAIGSILIDQKMTEFFNSYLESGCFPSIFININENVQDEEKRRAIVHNLKLQHQGSSKAAKMLVGFSSSPETKPDIVPLNSNDDDKKFESLRNWIRMQIITAWSNNAELAGGGTPGKLGNSDLIPAQMIFEQDVVKPMRNDIEKQINYLLKCNGFTDEIEIVSFPLIYPMEEQTRRQSYTINELRKQNGDDEFGIGGNVIILPNGSIQLHPDGKMVGTQPTPIPPASPNFDTSTTDNKSKNDVNVMKENDPSADEKTSTNNN